MEGVEKFEEANGIMFPEEMKKYMTYVSSSIFKNFLGVRDMWINENAIKKFPEPTNYETCIDEDFTKLATTFVKVYEFRSIGCGGYDYIILEGPLRGTIWQGNFGYDMFYSRNKSFYDYIMDFREQI